jgi:error-prone DNA polymerase
MPRYAELHCHTNFSFLDGASHPWDLAQRAAELGYEALAVTDHDGFYGAARFRLAAAEVGLPTVYGVEVGLPRKSPVPSPESRVRLSSPVGGGGSGRRPLTEGEGERVGGLGRVSPPPSPPSAVRPPSGGERRKKPSPLALA